MVDDAVEYLLEYRKDLIIYLHRQSFLKKDQNDLNSMTSSDSNRQTFEVRKVLVIFFFF